MEWTPVPEPVTWTMPVPIADGGLTYTKVTLRAPTGEDIMKATAIQGASGTDVAHRLVEVVSGVPYNVVKKLPWWQIQQMSGYMDEFAGAPAPDPLEQWRTDRRAAARAEAAAEIAAAAAAEKAASSPAS